MCGLFRETNPLRVQTILYSMFFVCLIKCFTSTVNSCGNAGMVSYLTTRFLAKRPGGSLPVLSAHSLPVTDNLLFLNQRKRKIICIQWEILGNGAC